LGHTVLGLVLEVSHRTAHVQTLQMIQAHQPDLVLGFGVAVDRLEVTVERFAWRKLGERPDVNGEVLPLPNGPGRLNVSVPAQQLADALGGQVSVDAGNYVCNGWLYRMLLSAPDACIGFVHLPPAGLAPVMLARALASHMESP
jgi:pyrrolidone-carboxylate peptidase